MVISTPLSVMESSPPKVAGKSVKHRKKSVVRSGWKPSVVRNRRKVGGRKKEPNVSVSRRRQLVHELSKDMNSAFDALKKWNKDELLEVLRVESGEKKLYNKWNKGPIINELLKIVTEEKDLPTTTSTSKMSVGEKSQLVHEQSKDPDSAFDPLNKSNKDELLAALRVESMEKTELEKGVINKEPLKIVSAEKDSSTSKMSGEERQLVHELSKDSDSALKFVSEEKRSSTTSMRDAARGRKGVNPIRHVSTDKSKATTYCRNHTCRAIKRVEDLFCKRCTCCICYKFGEDSDPSLWLTCDSDPPFPGESCRLTCHLDCAIKVEKSGLKADNPSDDVDGCYYCVSCGKKNSLLKCWTRQLWIANVTNSVEILCFRLVMAQKLLKGTEKYRKLSEPVDEAVKVLETELRVPLDDLPSTMCKGAVEKLDSAPKVKELCLSALKYLRDTRLVDYPSPFMMPGPTSNVAKQTTVEETKVSTEPPQEEEGGKKEATAVNSLSTNDEEKQLALKETVPEKAVNKGKIISSSSGFGLEDCVKILRQLESSGHVDTTFRQKFLTWYSLNASAEEKIIVKTFVDVFIDDPVALAEQLIDSFSEHIARKRCATGGSNSSA